MRLDALPESRSLLDDVSGGDAAQHLVRAVVVLGLEPVLETKFGAPLPGIQRARASRGLLKPSFRRPFWISGIAMNSRHSSPER